MRAFATDYDLSTISRTQQMIDHKKNKPITLTTPYTGEGGEGVLGCSRCFYDMIFVPPYTGEAGTETPG